MPSQCRQWLLVRAFVALETAFPVVDTKLMAPLITGPARRNRRSAITKYFFTKPSYLLLTAFCGLVDVISFSREWILRDKARTFFRLHEVFRVVTRPSWMLFGNRYDVRSTSYFSSGLVLCFYYIVLRSAWFVSKEKPLGGNCRSGTRFHFFLDIEHTSKYY